MDTDRDSRQRALLARMREIEGEHRASVETGDKTQAGALYAQGQTLCEAALREEQDATNRALLLATEKAKSFGASLKAAVRRMAAVQAGGE